MNDESSLQHAHDPVEQALDDLEAAHLTAPCCSEVSFVPALPFERQIFQRHVGNFEDFDRHAVMLVFSHGFEKAGEQRGPDDLIFGRFGVSESDRRLAIVLPVKPSEILVVRAKDERHHLAPASHGRLDPNNIAKFVDH